jgi:hypothetical protein
MMGRGYSGNTFAGLIWDAQSVLILSPAGFHCYDASDCNNAKNDDRRKSSFSLDPAQ